MRAGVRCSGAALAPVQLRGAARLAPTLRRVAPASRCLQGAGRRALLDQGCALRLVAAAAEGVETVPVAPRGRGRPRKAAGGEAAQVAPPERKRKAPRVGELGEKTADGKPKPDERTVAYLVALGWWETEEEVVAVLTRGASQESRYPFETAKTVADWLEATLGCQPLKEGGLRPGAKAVKAFPSLLCQDAATLQSKWDALTLSREQGGVGIGFSEEQAREAVLKHPQTMGLGVDTFARGWSMLTATKGGLGLSPEEARKGILRGPNILRYDYDYVIRRVGLLKELGYADPLSMVLASPPLLNYGEEVVKEHAAWWKQTQLDHMKITTNYPTLLGAPQTVELQSKLSFLRDVAKLSDADLKNGGALFLASFDKKLRPRFFYALKHGAIPRLKLSSLTFCPDARYLRMVHQLGVPANKAEIGSYKEEVASADFQAWAAHEEALRRSGAAS